MWRLTWLFAFSYVDRFTIVSMVALACLASTLPVSPAEAEKVIGLVAESRSVLAIAPSPATFTLHIPPASAEPSHGIPFDGFLRELYKLGSDPGVIKCIGSTGPDLEGCAQSLEKRNVSLIVTFGTPPTIAAQKATRTTPIVMIGVAEPVDAGFVKSLARPGGRITGVSFLGPELLAKAMQLLKEAVPNAANIAVLLNPDNPAARQGLTPMERTAATLGVRLLRLTARSQDELASLFNTLPTNLSGLVVVNDALFIDPSLELTKRISVRHLPAVFQLSSYVLGGGLMSYGPEISELYRRGAALSYKILNGAQPAQLPVEQPTKFELAINLKTASALGLTIPQTLLLRADQVIVKNVLDARFRRLIGTWNGTAGYPGPGPREHVLEITETAGDLVARHGYSAGELRRVDLSVDQVEPLVSIGFRTRLGHGVRLYLTRDDWLTGDLVESTAGGPGMHQFIRFERRK
jgi:putative tryptophan/tyrosine transport system substrate-binding protein